MEDREGIDRTKEAQVCSATRCMFCDIVLAGRIQFIGHMIHNHDLLYEQALEMLRPLNGIMSQNSRLHFSSESYNNNNNNSMDFQIRAASLRARK